jgi:hypothetical protein
MKKSAMISHRAIEIERRVKQNGESLADIARDLGISRQRVSIVLKEAGIELNLRGGNPKPKSKPAPRADNTTYPLSQVTTRIRLPQAVDEALAKLPTSADRTTWLRKVIAAAAIKEFGITL